MKWLSFSTDRPTQPGTYLAVPQNGGLEIIAIVNCWDGQSMGLKALTRYGQHDPLLFYKAFKEFNTVRA